MGYLLKEVFFFTILSFYSPSTIFTCFCHFEGAFFFLSISFSISFSSFFFIGED
ncbi:hypothetical protein BY996DRAFT_7054802 [Phakopsora pachyrhizi]|nr:hypothetical protein BY996DRAFT_7054802 [Phakopsora pachyrhizi]